jgi:hypothetical protein
LSQNQPHLDRKRTTFIHHFLVNDLDDWSIFQLIPNTL